MLTLTERLSACIRDLEPIWYTRYTDECCRVVEEACQYVTDAYLVRLVRMTQIADRINRAFSYDDSDPSWGLSVPLGFSIRWLRVEVLQLKSSVPPDIPQSCESESVRPMTRQLGTSF
jgi:hypothetical protein